MDGGDLGFVSVGWAQKLGGAFSLISPRTKNVLIRRTAGRAISIFECISLKPFGSVTRAMMTRLMGGGSRLVDGGFDIGIRKSWEDAIRLAARTEAMMTDPVYEGKSMQGMIDIARKGFFPKGSKVLYAQLGGAPALNGYSYYYKDG